MKNKLNFYIAPAILICWCLFSIQSCKDPVILSKNLLTKSDTLNLAKDTLAIVCTTVLQNNLSSSGIIDGILGSMSDHNFGVTYAGFYAQCALTTTSPTFGTKPILDSVVLSLGFDAPYGSCSKPVNIYVYELNQDLLTTGNYFTTTSFQVKTPPIGQKLHYVPDFVDSIEVVQAGGNEAPQLRIDLTQAFGYKLLNADSVSLLSDSLFLVYFKGIYVTAAGPVGNGMMACNLSSALSSITMYYRNTDTGDSIENSFSFPTTGVSVNHSDNNYFGTPVLNAIQNPTANNQKLYLEGGGGLYDKILFNIDTLKKQNTGVNKAELVVALSRPDSLSAAPSSLTLLYIDDAGVGQLVEDASTTSFGGSLQEDTLNGLMVSRYHFNISIYMQRVLQGIHNNNGLYLEIPSANSNPARVVLTNPTPGTPNSNIYRTYLTVLYTKL